MDMFNSKFIWLHGEYKIRVKVITKNNEADIEKTYKFTLFEYYEQILKDSVEDYKYGSSIYWTKSNPLQQSITISIKEDI